VALCCLLLASCGGIEGTGSPVAGIEGTGVTEGTVTGFGSVYVNGIEYATDRADIVVDGRPASEDALQIGMVLTVVGDIAADGLTGVARHITAERLLFGAVEAVDIENHRLTVLGQALDFDDRTVFAGAPETDIQPGDLLSVSGLFDSDGLLATRVVREEQAYRPGTTVAEVEGTVRTLAAGSFRIGELLVDYTGAVIDAGQAPLVEGARVEVHGVQSAAGEALQAEQVTVRTLPPLENGQPVSLEGVIQQFTSLGDFTVNGRRVDALTAQRNDGTGLQPANDVRIRLQGLAQSGDQVAAQSYELLPAGEYSMTGRVEQVDQDSQALSVFGQPQLAQGDTQYQDLQAGQRRFRLDEVRPGDFVELRGFTDQDGRFLLSRIERREAEEAPPIILIGGLVVIDSDLGRICIGDCTARRVRGPLQGANAVNNTLVISGVTVNTNPATTRFSDRDGNAVNSVDFYNAVRPGDRLVAEGTDSTAGMAHIDARQVRYAYFQF
jgi:hypothetical protein